MQADPAFQEHVSGLLVPLEHVRTRQVWTKAEWALLDRVNKLLHRQGVTQLLECQNPACNHEIHRVKPTPDGGYTLRCSCTDRVLQKAF